LEALTPSDDLGPIRVVLKPDPDEAARVLSRQVLRKPVGIAIMAFVIIVCLGIAALGFALIFARHVYFFGTFCVVFACALLVLWPLQFRSALARRLGKNVTPGGSEVTFSANGLDTKSQHTSAHIDWEAVKSVRTVHEGLMLQAGRVTTFISRRNFESDAEYDRALVLIGSKLGTRAELSER
jgi:hypothetical protein